MKRRDERNKIKNEWAKKREHHANPLLEEDERSRLPRISKEGTGPTGVEPDGTTLGSFGDSGATRTAKARIAIAAGGLCESISRLGGGGEGGDEGGGGGEKKEKSDSRGRGRCAATVRWDEERSCGTKTRRWDISLAPSPRLRPRWGRGEAEEEAVHDERRAWGIVQSIWRGARRDGEERPRGPRGDASRSYRILASRSSHVRATATPRDRRRNRTALRALVRHSCSLSLSLSFFPPSFLSTFSLLCMFCSFSSLLASHCWLSDYACSQIWRHCWSKSFLILVSALHFPQTTNII